ncbi:hypothetical protein ASE21_14955 [Flavobacterium sp. Root901]|uniref:competence protein CoiA n=1 Tax=Flavobacterium sp. Root901 TaxID=1736605 RepID=UPI00070B4760|nr:competence protein CoiA family protein [Flavobacterium sp. Root901]KRD09144.1 hypothetical protein ASE21_14955 [Flavobacterium sp. Root901]
MQHAIDIDGKKISPSSSGQIAVCGFCGEKVRGRCGEINIWHWQHVSNADCDVWKEGETEWHRVWKSQFPFDWQETIIEKNDERHIADILTSDGIVIEFQNSAISSSTISIRERFYEKMIWVINAQSFKNNLITEDVAGKQLAEIDNRYAEKKRLLSKHNSQALLNLKQNQNARASEIQSREYELRQLMSVTDIFKSCNKNAETFAEQIINIWQSDNLAVDPSLIEITNDDALVSKKMFFRLLADLKRNKHYLDLRGNTTCEIEKLDFERKEILAELESLKPVVKEELKFVASKYLYLEDEIAQLQRIISFLEGKDAADDKQMKDLKAEIDNYINANLKILEADFLEERNEIIQDKNKLKLTWKHARKSWLSAAAPIYFDIGDGKLLYNHPDNKVSILTVGEFISTHDPADN